MSFKPKPLQIFTNLLTNLKALLTKSKVHDIIGLFRETFKKRF